MFRSPEQLSSAATRPRPQQLLNRALLLGLGLLLLWVAVQLFPHDLQAAAPAASDDAGAVASRTVVEDAGGEAPSYFSAGNIAALLLLAAGGGVALYLRRRSPLAGAGGSLFASVGSFALTPGQELRMVRCHDEVLLLGVSSGQITLLKSYPADAFEADAAPANAGRNGHAPARPMADPHTDFANSHFADVLRNYAARHTQARSPRASH